MTHTLDQAPAWLAAPVTGVVLAAAAYVVAVVHTAMGGVVAGTGMSVREALATPWREASRLLVQQRVTTERPDATVWALGPAIYAAMAAVAFTVVPLSSGFVLADVESGIVLWGAAEAIAIVAVFLDGWGPNSMAALAGGYRFVALALSYELLSMFVLIAAALPAESLQVSAIVESQHDLWNVVRQPLGLPLFLVVTLGVAFWGPLDVVGGPDLGGGTQAEASGSHRLAWLVARGAMLATFATMAATVFLGGWLGPWLPGPVWLAVKSLGVVVVAVGAGHLVGRVRMDRVVTWMWAVLLPLAFADLAVAGLGALP